MATPFPRKKKRLIVEFVDGTGARQSAFTRDVSLTGIFVVSDSTPKMGETAAIRLHLPRAVVPLVGKVVRQGRSSGSGGGAVTSGFAFALTVLSEEYQQFIQTLV